MTSERWLLVSPHLDQVLDLTGDERQQYLEDLASRDPALAADLELLLGEERALRDENYLEHDAQDLLARPYLAGQVFGAYALLQPLGAGGMGTVWLARRNDGHFEGTAAVKILSAALLDTSGISRFRREGTILARLKHPNIAQLFDAGISEAGQPYSSWNMSRASRSIAGATAGASTSLFASGSFGRGAFPCGVDDPPEGARARRSRNGDQHERSRSSTCRLFPADSDLTSEADHHRPWEGGGTQNITREL